MQTDAATLEAVGEIDRKTYIGGSDVAAIMGLGATYDGVQQTPLTVYLRKIGEAPQMDAKQQLFLARRKRFEDPIVAMLREEFDGNIVATNKRYRDPEYDFMAAEIDWEWADQDGSIQNGETKTVHAFAFGESQGWGDPGTSDYPVQYVTQNMYGLGITGRQTCIVAAMVGIDNMIFYRLERDDEVIGIMRERVRDFWIKNVLARVPPEPLSYEDCLRLTLRMRGKPVEVDESIAKSISLLREIREESKANEITESEIKFDVLDFIRKKWLLDPEAEVVDNAVLNFGGRKIATFNAQSTNRIDAERLRDEKPEIAAAFTKTTRTRVLRIPKPK